MRKFWWHGASVGEWLWLARDQCLPGAACAAAPMSAAVLHVPPPFGSVLVRVDGAQISAKDSAKVRLLGRIWPNPGGGCGMPSASWWELPAVLETPSGEELPERVLGCLRLRSWLRQAAIAVTFAPGALWPTPASASASCSPARLRSSLWSL